MELPVYNDKNPFFQILIYAVRNIFIFDFYIEIRLLFYLKKCTFAIPKKKWEIFIFKPNADE